MIMLPDFFEEIKHIEKEIQEVLEKFQKNNNLYMSAHSGYCPPMDIFENEGSLVAVLDVPGIDSKSINITYLNQTVTITGEKKQDNEDLTKHFHCIERNSGKFVRKFRVYKPIDMENTKSVLKNGILTIHLKLLSEDVVKPVVIEVEQLD